MDLQSKPEASERAIPEKDKHENEKLKVALKLQYSPLSPVKRRQRPRMAQRQQDIQRPNDGAKKIMTHSMDLQSKPAALERAIPENDEHENENLEMRELPWAKILTKVEIQTCSICFSKVVDLARHIMDMHSKPAAAPEKMILYRNGLRRSMDMQSKPATPEKTMPKINLNERESLFVTFDLESTGETPFFFSFLAVIALFWRNV